MLIIFLISCDSGQNKIGGYRKKVDRINIWRFHGDFQEGYQALKPEGVDDNPTILVCSRCMSQRYDCFYTDSALLYHSGWLRLVHFDHTTIVMQGGDVPSAVR